MSRKALMLAGATFACLSALFPATAQAGEYNLVLTMKSENGQQFEMPMPSGDYSECYRDKKKQEIGRVIPRGVLISPGGKSYAATVVGARCVLSSYLDGKRN